MRSARRIPELLDETPLNGVVSLRRELGPRRHVYLVDVNNALPQAIGAIGSLCQMWGGSASIILPIDLATLEPRETWARFLEEQVIDGILVDTDLGDDGLQNFEDRYLGNRPLVGGPVLHDLIPFLVSYDRDTSQWAPTRVPCLESDDPWLVAYTATFGVLPEQPETHLYEEILRLRSDLEWNEIVRVEFETVEGAHEDLLARLVDGHSTFPRALTQLELGVGRFISSLAAPTEGVLPRRHLVPNQIGPSFVVVYEPGSGEDLALLWNLRWAYGVPIGAPLAVPSTVDVPSVLQAWRRNLAIRSHHLSGSWLGITSLSTSKDRLEEIAQSSEGDWQAVDANELFLPSDRATRTSHLVATFTNGIARVPIFDPADQQIAKPRRNTNPNVVARFIVEKENLPEPEVPTHSFQDTPLRGGGVELVPERHSDVSRLTWPTGWDVLTKMLGAMDLQAEPSEAGKAAGALMARLGSLQAIDPLRSEQVVELLYRLGERRGSNRFKRQISRLAKELKQPSDAARPDLSKRIQDLYLTATDDERPEFTVDQIGSALGNKKLGAAWVDWAEDHGILVRGVRVSCESCGLRAWTPVGDIAPPVVCAGCGDTIAKPFRPDIVQFRYVASETLLRALEHDVVPQILAMRFFARLFETTFAKDRFLCGMFPGVELRRLDGPLGEADLLLLFSDGSIVVGEFKLRASGLTIEELDKLHRVAGAIGSSWTFVGTLAWKAELGEEWKPVVEPPPRLTIAGDQLFGLDDVDLVTGTHDDTLLYSADDLEVKRLEASKRFSDRLEDLLMWLRTRPHA